MKATIEEPVFHPVTLTLTCETQEELDTLACIFILKPINDSVLRSEPIWQMFVEMGGETTNANELARNIANYYAPCKPLN